MELRHLGYFVAVGEDQHYGGASRRLGVAQPALSRQIQDLEKEIGFRLFDRMPRGVKLSAAGELFLEDAKAHPSGCRRGDGARRARGAASRGRCASASPRMYPGTALLRIPSGDSGSDLQLQPAASLEQLEAIRSGRLDAGFVNFMPKADADLDQLTVGRQQVERSPCWCPRHQSGKAVRRGR
jgi:DNA-binding transcriptional LysR family regulator